MSDEYINRFINALVLTDDIHVDEFESYVAIVRGSTRAMFRDMQPPWKLKFEIENALMWRAIEYDVDRDDEFEVMSGHVHVVLTDTQHKGGELIDVDPSAYEFIECLFPGSEVIQVFPDGNVFLVDDIIYDFDKMKSGNKWIQLKMIRTL